MARQCASTTAQDRAERPVATAVNGAAQQATRQRADQCARRATTAALRATFIAALITIATVVIAAAIIPAAVIVADVAWTLLMAPVVTATDLFVPVMVTLCAGRLWHHRGGRGSEKRRTRKQFANHHPSPSRQS